jgi:hypothetical protein
MGSLDKYISSFWTHIYKQPEFTVGLLKAYNSLFDHLSSRVDTFHQDISRHTVVPKRPVEWSLYEVPLGSFETPLLFSDGAIFDTGVIFDSALPTRTLPCPLSSRCDDVKFILSDPAAPSVIWQKDIHFTIDTDRRCFFFKNDPRSLSDFKQAFNASGDMCVQLWLHKCSLDYSDIAHIYGDMIKISLASEDYDKRLVNALWDNLNDGCTIKAGNALMAAIADSDICEEDGIVGEVFTEAGRAWVSVYDSSARASGRLYSAPDVSSAIVEAGDTVKNGQLLFDSISIYRKGDTLPTSEVPGLHLSPSLIGPDFGEGVLVENKDSAFPGKRWYVVTDSDTGVLVDDVTEADYSYLVENFDGINITLLVDDPSAQYSLVEGRRDLPYKGRPDNVAAFQEYVTAAGVKLGANITDAAVARNNGKEHGAGTHRRRSRSDRNRSCFNAILYKEGDAGAVFFIGVYR